MGTTTQKPKLSFWQIWNMSFGFFGIQFGFVLQNTNTSGIFSTLGAEVSSLSILWLAAPLTGMIVQPIIGYFSDNTWHPKWGRRRPFFFFGAILAALMLFLMPNSHSLAAAVVVLWLMDSAINISMEPFRAFVGDKLDISQQTTGFAMQTFLIGCGGVIASLLPTLFTYLGISNIPVNGAISDSVRYSYYVGGFAFLIAVSWTVFSTQEIPPENLEKFYAERKNRTLGHIVGEIFGGFGKMPATMVQLAFVQFFTWAAFFAMWTYLQPAVSENIFMSVDAQSKAYQDGVNWNGVMSSVYTGVSALAAFVLPVFARYTSRKIVHLHCLVIGGLSLASIFLVTDKYIALIPMVGVGLAWASTLTMPYAILAGSLPPERMGYFMGLFNFFIVIPQSVAGVVLGPVVKQYFGGHPVKAVLLGGISLIIAGLLTIWVKDEAGKKLRQQSMSS